MANPYSTIEELPDFTFPYHELDDEYTERQGLDHPINWLH
jgi:hypothetical protein